MGYYDSRIYGNNLDDPTMTAALFAAYMTNTEFLYFRGHGAKNYIMLNAAQTVRFRSTYISELPTNIFNNCKLVLYASCLTGQGRDTGMSLVNSTANRGVATVIGFETEVKAGEVDAWSIRFFEALSNGSTVSDACSAAYSAISTNPPLTYYNEDGMLGTQTCYIAGSENATYN